MKIKLRNKIEELEAERDELMDKAGECFNKSETDNSYTNVAEGARYTGMARGMHKVITEIKTIMNSEWL